MNARALDLRRAAYRPDLIAIDVSFISLAKVLPAVLACARRALRLPRARQAAVRGRDASGWAREGWCARLTTGARRSSRSAKLRAALGHSVLGFASSGLPGPGGQPGEFVWIAEGGREGARDDLEARRARGGAVKAAAHGHHPHPPGGGGDLRRRPPRDRRADRRGDRRCGWTRTRWRSTRSPSARGSCSDADPAEDGTDLAIVLGGDGTMLRAMRTFAGRGVPVFSFNFGAIGFLATVERDELEDGHPARDRWRLRAARDARAGDRCRRSPASRRQRHLVPPACEQPCGGAGVQRWAADQLGSVRCDGLVVSTPGRIHGLQPRQRRPGAGVGRGGLRGVVHRAAHAHRASAGGGHGRRADRAERLGERARGRDHRRAHRVRARAPGRDGHPLPATTRCCCAQRPGSNFYHRLREKFGRLAY